MSHLGRFLLVAGMALGLPATAGAAEPDSKLGSALGALWEIVLETPPDQNPYLHPEHACVDLGQAGRAHLHQRVVAPFAPPGVTSISCTVRPGAKVLMTAWSSECSTVEDPPYLGENEAELRECARAADAGFELARVTVDGVPVTVTEVETRLLSLHIPADNLFGVPAQSASSVGHGWVVLLNPLTPGTHEIVIHVEGTDGSLVPTFTNTTTIVVQPAIGQAST